jgi:RNA polymerase sigma-70 factor (ECF subfamily)
LSAADTKPREPATSAAELYRTYAAFVTSFVRRNGVPPNEVEDVVQETFLVAHRQGGYRPGPATPKSWLASIAIRVGISRRRSLKRKRRREELGGAALAPNAVADPEQATEQQAMLRRMQEALDALDANKREVFILFELEGEDCSSIAAALNVPVGTVYSRLHGARKNFMAHMNELLQQQEASQ